MTGQESAHLAESDWDDLREMCGPDGDWGGTGWGEVILGLLSTVESFRRPLTRDEVRSIAAIDDALTPWLPEIQSVFEAVMTARLDPAIPPGQTGATS